MRVANDLKNSVCFLCGKNSDGSYDARGTGFFITVSFESRPDAGYLYLVTAKHVIDRAKAKGYENFHLRMNTVHGRADFMEVSDSWKYPKEPEPPFAIPDVAVMPIYELEPEFAVAAMPIQMALADQTSIEAHGVGIGDEVLLVGLFTKRYGYQRNIPIVRVGAIAAMPEEPIQDNSETFYDAYLIEIRSIGGLSGSPVIVFKSEIAGRTPNLGLALTQTNGYLLGLIRGHWQTDKDAIVDFPDEDDYEPLNTGIAMVTPIQEALNIINGPDLTQDRQRLDRLRAEKNGQELD